jgi:hypothetical protein
LLIIGKFYRKTLKIIKPSLQSLQEIYLSKFDFNITLSIIGIIFLIIGVGVIVFIAPPNTWDAMNYHMSRIMHWIQNQSLAHYPTSFEPQLYQSPLAELIILHFQILSGGDRFANAVQWFSMIGCVIGASLIAKQIEGSLSSQVISALIVTTIPMGILQASSVKNDYLLAFWLICLANILFFLDRQFIRKKILFLLSLAFSVSLGLALLTKGTANVYALPFTIYFFWILLKKLRQDSWQFFLSFGVVIFIINFGYYTRNFILYGSFLGPLRESQDASSSYKNEIVNPLVLISNLLRNIGSNLGTPIRFLNQKIYALINKIHGLMGMDINDTRTTFSGNFYIPSGLPTLGFSGNEDNASNTIICLLALSAIIIFLFNKKLRKNRKLTIYLSLVLSSLLLFSLLVKWQPWVTRLHLPIFVLFSSFVAVVFTKILTKKQLRILILVLIISALPWLMLNRYRPLVGSYNIFQSSRLEQYFVRQQALKEPYLEAASFLKAKNCSIIGLDLKNPYEYPLWIALKNAQIDSLQLQHINVKDYSSVLYKKKKFHDFEPCAIFYLTDKNSTPLQSLNVQGKIYYSQWHKGRVSIFTIHLD